MLPVCQFGPGNTDTEFRPTIVHPKILALGASGDVRTSIIASSFHIHFKKMVGSEVDIRLVTIVNL